ncbi:MAG: biotin carboxylase N-terminal domain-containing protein [Armatimonadota bacterium]|nr:biotin carboxylase N-terminal domain-containing protein [Armatimonadota bacterium]MDR7518471.1 biotin carboxylase N-terminal domain-containing protein [Armatimonadota bacterium]
MPPLRRLLIANRGEIAVRIVRACRDLGVSPVAVYAPIDADSPHVRLADDAFALPGDAPHDGYLNAPLLVDLARRAGASAIHPGYGFLAENPAFAAACEAAGIAFVGPPAEVLARCGDKAAARAAAAEAGVPVLPGTDPVGDDEAARAARAVGFPLLIKAVGGGGGKGIHLVRAPAELPAHLRLARGEAQTAFGDPRVYLERWLERSRHVEVQILADQQGRAVHLGERACSVQRRHQKLIEEAPAPGLDPGVRDALTDAAVRVATALGYRNAGTIEFLVEGDAFYFLEVNARIQVEHPVTEATTGVDLVASQLLIAAGEPLPFRQEDVRASGWAIECRISAEDPHGGFLPSLGRIDGVVEPAGPGIRVDSGLWVGQTVSRHFDPLLAKVIASGPTREAAIARARRALAEFAVSGVDTTIPFHLWALEQPAFVQGAYDVHFAEQWGGGPTLPEAERLAVLAAAAWFHRKRQRPALPTDGASPAWIAAARQEVLR